MKKLLLAMLAITATGGSVAHAETSTAPAASPFAKMLLASQNSKVEKSMCIVRAEVQINAPIEKVWQIVGNNFDENSKFNVGAKESLYLKKVPGIKGSQRRTINHKDKVIDVEVIEYDQEKKHVKWEVYNQNVAPMKAAYSSYSLRENEEGITILEQRAAFKMKFFFLDWVAQMKFPGMFKTELAAIKHLAETGESITQENRETIAKRYATSIKLLK
jgi:hypothetical protein